ncbi:chemotaxis protein CheB [Gramella sp. MAR_2010_147]|uniref:chemotaxis protein CheB n=1 Tax=Gramella sp. MAR_2010_147 TaxID=1250205 RepID=UPI000AE2B609|nr:chemotaxis protein CheB [Gramella sp. MAR_2010_147]
MEEYRIFTIGASAGGRVAIEKVFEKIPAGINASFLIVVHSSFDMISSFSKHLNQKIALEVLDAQENMKIETGKVYVSASNQHMVIMNERISNSNGPRENLFRPSIDVLFRSAAVAFGNRNVGILLSGRLNDGTVGLEAIKKCGGLTIIQDPETAEYSGMPLTAQKFVDINQCLNLEEIGNFIVDIVDKPLPDKKDIPYSLIRESEIATNQKSD